MFKNNELQNLAQYAVNTILEQSENMQEVVIYSGRFQPFHPGHHDVYQHLVKKFGKDNVYIGTSNKTNSKNSPLNFKEKKNIITTLFNVPQSKVVQVKNPYAPTEVLSKYDPESTAYITVVGPKDRNRLKGKYFDEYSKNIPLQGFKEKGYVYVVPGSATMNISATQVRHAFSEIHTEEEHEEFFKKIYPKFDKRVLKIFQEKFSKFTNPIKIEQKIVEEFIAKKFPAVIKEVSQSGGPNGSDADDGPVAYYDGMETYNNVSIRRAERIGWELVKQIDTETYDDIEEFPEYPDGPIKAVSSFPAGVPGELTATNQEDFDDIRAYNRWFDHVTRSMAMTGYELIKFYLKNSTYDQEDIDQSVEDASHVEDDEAAEQFDDSMRVDERKQSLLSSNEMDSVIEAALESIGLMHGYPSKEEYEEKLRKVKKMQDKFVADREEDKEYTPVNENFNKLEFYLEHYRNLSPSDFKLNIDESKITIDVQSNSLTESRSFKDRGQEPFVDDLEDMTEFNDKYRDVIWTGEDFQLALMSIEPNQETGIEVHHEVEQFIRFEAGEGKIQIGKGKEELVTKNIEDDFFVIIPKGYYHNIISTGDEPLKLYTIYSKQVHEQGTVDVMSEQIQNLSSSLDIDRTRMPQIDSESENELIEWLTEQDIVVIEKDVRVGDLKAAQKHFDDEKVKEIIDNTNNGREISPIWISEDGYVIDGLHRTIAAFNIDKDFEIDVYEVGCDLEEAIELINKFPTTTQKSVVEQLDEMKLVAESSLQINIPRDIKDIYKAFKRSGKKLYIVGGAVRDAILGKNPKDIDLATDAKPDEVLKIAKKAGFNTVEVGKQFGVVIVGGHEIATFRKDINLKDNINDFIKYLSYHNIDQSQIKKFKHDIEK